MRKTPFKKVVVRAPAKLNLSLAVVGEDTGGYHRLDGVMLAVDLYDIVTLQMKQGEGIQIDCDCPQVPLDDNNLAVKTARFFLKHMGASVPIGKLMIQIDKQIPMQAGMAGGSADAAAVLVGLNTLYSINFSLPKLMEIGLNLGADVPFCLQGGCARATGRGEKLKALPLPQGVFLIAKPVGGNDTAEAFSRYDSYREKLRRPDVAAMEQALLHSDIAATGKEMGNVFQQVCAPRGVQTIVNAMAEQGALGVTMTGTGTAVAGLFAQEDQAQVCLESLEKVTVPLEYVGIHRAVQTGASVTKMV